MGDLAETGERRKRAGSGGDGGTVGSRFVIFRSGWLVDDQIPTLSVGVNVSFRRQCLCVASPSLVITAYVNCSLHSP
jgi:hypothetical protein